MNVDEFGRALIETGDLDPVYIAIHGAKLPKSQLARLLLGYWSFYHLGLAAWLSEQEDWGLALEVAAANEQPSPLGGRWPRSAERRHFRGKKCVQAVKWLAQENPEVRIASLGNSFDRVTAEIKTWPMHGDWVAYKAADMMERCWGGKFEFPLDVCLLYDEPRKGLLMLNPDKPEQELDRLLGVFKRYKAPPAYDRACGVAEAETILCKYKSYSNRHYWVGKDIHEIRHGLEGWGDTASIMLRCSPKEVVVDGLFGLAS